MKLPPPLPQRVIPYSPATAPTQLAANDPAIGATARLSIMVGILHMLFGGLGLLGGCIVLATNRSSGPAPIEVLIIFGGGFFQIISAGVLLRGGYLLSKGDRGGLGMAFAGAILSGLLAAAFLMAIVIDMTSGGRSFYAATGILIFGLILIDIRLIVGCRRESTRRYGDAAPRSEPVTVADFFSGAFLQRSRSGNFWLLGGCGMIALLLAVISGVCLAQSMMSIPAAPAPTVAVQPPGSPAPAGPTTPNVSDDEMIALKDIDLYDRRRGLDSVDRKKILDRVASGLSPRVRLALDDTLRFRGAAMMAVDPTFPDQMADPSTPAGRAVQQARQSRSPSLTCPFDAFTLELSNGSIRLEDGSRNLTLNVSPWERQYYLENTIHRYARAGDQVTVAQARALMGRLGPPIASTAMLQSSPDPNAFVPMRRIEVIDGVLFFEAATEPSDVLSAQIAPDGSISPLQRSPEIAAAPAPAPTGPIRLKDVDVYDFDKGMPKAERDPILAKLRESSFFRQGSRDEVAMDDLLRRQGRSILQREPQFFTLLSNPGSSARQAGRYGNNMDFQSTHYQVGGLVLMTERNGSFALSNDHSRPPLNQDRPMRSLAVTERTIRLFAKPGDQLPAVQLAALIRSIDERSTGLPKPDFGPPMPDQFEPLLSFKVRDDSVVIYQIRVSGKLRKISITPDGQVTDQPWDVADPARWTQPIAVAPPTPEKIRSPGVAAKPPTAPSPQPAPAVVAPTPAPVAPPAPVVSLAPAPRRLPIDPVYPLLATIAAACLALWALSAIHAIRRRLLPPYRMPVWLAAMFPIFSLATLVTVCVLLSHRAARDFVGLEDTSVVLLALLALLAMVGLSVVLIISAARRIAQGTGVEAAQRTY